VGIIAGKPSQDFTHPLGMLRGLKGLLHMLNAIVSPTKADLCFLFFLCFHFCFAKGKSMPNIVYLTPLFTYVCQALSVVNI
jgi:hypothetical protein